MSTSPATPNSSFADVIDALFPVDCTASTFGKIADAFEATRDEIMSLRSKIASLERALSLAPKAEEAKCDRLICSTSNGPLCHEDMHDEITRRGETIAAERKERIDAESRATKAEARVEDLEAELAEANKKHLTATHIAGAAGTGDVRFWYDECQKLYPELSEARDRADMLKEAFDAEALLRSQVMKEKQAAEHARDEAVRKLGEMAKELAETKRNYGACEAYRAAAVDKIDALSSELSALESARVAEQANCERWKQRYENALKPAQTSAPVGGWYDKLVPRPATPAQGTTGEDAKPNCPTCKSSKAVSRITIAFCSYSHRCMLSDGGCGLGFTPCPQENDTMAYVKDKCAHIFHNGFCTLFVGHSGPHLAPVPEPVRGETGKVERPEGIDDDTSHGIPWAPITGSFRLHALRLEAENKRLRGENAVLKSNAAQTSPKDHPRCGFESFCIGEENYGEWCKRPQGHHGNHECERWGKWPESEIGKAPK